MARKYYRNKVNKYFGDFIANLSKHLGKGGVQNIVILQLKIKTISLYLLILQGRKII